MCKNSSIATPLAMVIVRGNGSIIKTASLEPLPQNHHLIRAGPAAAASI